jgi:hypothetical protein
MKIIIQNDLYDITYRIKSIDSGYFIVFDTVSKSYEVHNTNNIGSTFCLKIPYSRLDARTVNLVNRTRTERFTAHEINI